MEYTFAVHWINDYQAELTPVEEHPQGSVPLLLSCTHWPLKKFWKDGDDYPGEGMHWLDVAASELPEGTRLKITVEKLGEGRVNTQTAASSK